MTPTTTTESSACPECGVAVRLGQQFCSRCGASQTAGLAGGDLSEEERINLRRRLGGSTWVASDMAVAGAVPTTIPERAISAPRRRRRRRTWFRKKRYVLPLLLLLLGGGGVATALLQAESTVNELQRISTPPDQVSIQDESLDEITNRDAAIDTGPAQQALADAGVDPGGADAGGLRDRASTLGGLAEGAAVAAGVRDPSTDALTILVMGVDARPGAQIDIAVRPDALMVLRLDPVAQTCRVLAIPRDTLVNLPGYGQTKINHALMVGGIRYERLVVEQFLGIAVDRYALIDFEGFRAMVDAVGGVPITVPSEITLDGNVLFAAGPTTFDGEDALLYARYRGGADVDIGRIRRQQQLIRSLAAIASSRDIVGDVNDLLPAVEQHIRTDLTPVEIAELGKQYASTCSEERLQLDTLSGTIEQLPTNDPLFKQQLYYFIVEPEVVSAKVAALLGRDQAAP